MTLQPSNDNYIQTCHVPRVDGAVEARGDRSSQIALRTRGKPPTGRVTYLEGDRLLRMADVTCLLAMSRSTVYRHVAAGRLPEPTRLTSRCIVWKASVIHAWIAGLAADRPRHE